MNVQIDIIDINLLPEDFPWNHELRNDDIIYRYRFTNGFTYYRLTNHVYGPNERDRNIQDTIGILRIRFTSTYAVDSPEEMVRVFNQLQIPLDLDFAYDIFDHFHDNEDLLMEIFDSYLSDRLYNELADVVDEYYYRRNRRPTINDNRLNQLVNTPIIDFEQDNRFNYNQI